MAQLETMIRQDDRVAFRLLLVGRLQILHAASNGLVTDLSLSWAVRAWHEGLSARGPNGRFAILPHIFNTRYAKMTTVHLLSLADQLQTLYCPSPGFWYCCALALGCPRGGPNGRLTICAQQAKTHLAG